MFKNDHQNILEKIIGSATFSNKEVMKGLLKFLFESKEKGYILKETDIAIDFFKRDKNFIPGDDTIVRVNIFKLRSLLDTYYQNEGKKDYTTVEIPKGTYTLKFVNKGPKDNYRNRLSGKIIPVLLILSVIVNLLFLFSKNTSVQDFKNPILFDYIESGKAIDLVLGDPFFYRVNDSLPETIIVRDITINSSDELAKISQDINSNAIQKVKPLDYPYFSANNVRPLPDLITALAKANKTIRLQALSECNVDNIKQNNCIFLANINSFRYIARFLEQTDIRINTNPRQIIIKKMKGDTILSVPEFIHGYYTDYAFIVKIPGPENNLMTLMGDFHGSGISGLTNFITKNPKLTAFTEKIISKNDKFPQYFEMVVKVISYNYSDFNTEVIYFKPLESK